MSSKRLKKIGPKRIKKSVCYHAIYNKEEEEEEDATVYFYEENNNNNNNFSY